MKLLIQLPNNASTSKYPKTFPQPLNLFSFYSKGDIFIDLALMSFNLKKEQIINLLSSTINASVLKHKGQIIVNFGDYPADALYAIYYDYFLDFLKKKKKKVFVIGTYPQVFPEKFSSHNLLDIDYKKINYDFDFKKYPVVNKKYKVSIRVSLGCPRKCSICPVPICFNSKYEYFDIDKSIEKIRYLYNEGAKYFTFIDDNLTISKNFKSLLYKIDGLNLKGVQFHCQEGIDVDSFDEELGLLLKKLRFDDIKVAFENIKPDFLKKINKSHITLKKIENIISICQKLGIKLKTFFLMGLGESKQDILDNLKFFSKYHLDIRTNIIRNYNQKKKEKNILSNKELEDLKALSYAVGFFGSKLGIDIFMGENELRQKGYRIENNIVYGKVNFGFQTSRFEKGIKFIFNKKIKENIGDKIILLNRRGFING